MPSGSTYHWTFLNVNISACIYLYESNWFSNILFLDWTKRWLNHARFTSTIPDLMCRNWNKNFLSYIMGTFGQTSQELFCECFDIEFRLWFSMIPIALHKKQLLELETLIQDFNPDLALTKIHFRLEWSLNNIKDRNSNSFEIEFQSRNYTIYIERTKLHRWNLDFEIFKIRKIFINFYITQSLEFWT